MCEFLAIPTLQESVLNGDAICVGDKSDLTDVAMLPLIFSVLALVINI